MGKVIRIWIEGSITLPEGKDEDWFNERFLEFVEDNNMEFTGVTDEMKEELK